MSTVCSPPAIATFLARQPDRQSSCVGHQSRMSATHLLLLLAPAAAPQVMEACAHLGARMMLKTRLTLLPYLRLTSFHCQALAPPSLHCCTHCWLMYPCRVMQLDSALGWHVLLQQHCLPCGQLVKPCMQEGHNHSFLACTPHVDMMGNTAGQARFVGSW
jgi:hypothetical protein